MCKELYRKLKETYPEKIYEGHVENGNELYLDVSPDNILEISTHVNIVLGFPLVSMFASDERNLSNKFAIYYVFAYRKESSLLVLKTAIDGKEPTIKSISKTVHAAASYEREIKDLFGIIPVGHPDSRRLVFHNNWPDGIYPLRKDYPSNYRPEFVKKEQNFKKIKGEGVYEIPVGPVHAGIIEPGHFRFSVAGEPIINLEAQLYFVHKGIEKMCEGESIERCLYVSERISGDETYSNSLTYCQAVEKIAGIKIPERAEFTRVIFAELERLTSHLGDLGGICVDVAYLFAASQFKMMRIWAYQIADLLCGMRFLRSVNKLGGVRKDFIAGKELNLVMLLKRMKAELEDTVNIITSNSMFTDRVENTGILQSNIALDLNAVGPAGRASGMCYDVRKSHPYGTYKQLQFKIPKHSYGDVNCRMNVRIEECFESINLILQAIKMMPDGEILEPVYSVEPYKFAFGMTESPRGENIHWVMTGENNTIFRYKIRTPSFCNWPALCHAVQGNIVPDFPLINKSFNLSYAGNDL